MVGPVPSPVRATDARQAPTTDTTREAHTMTSTLTTSAPTLGKIVRHAGIAGQLSYSVSVTYAGEPASVVTFAGSTYGGPIVMVTPAMSRGMFVTDPSRFGEFGPEWVRRFFADAR